MVSVFRMNGQGIRSLTRGSMNTITMKSRAEWRTWLSENHERSAGVWLMYYKKGANQHSVEYEASVEEALCFGWVDSIIRKLDEEKYVRKFTPRNEKSRWSALNKKRAEKMIHEGFMTQHGMKKIEAARQNGSWGAKEQRPVLKFERLPEFAAALQKSKKARETFDRLAWTHQKQYLGWIETAKRPETRERRIAESVKMLEREEKLGLK